MKYKGFATLLAIVLILGVLGYLVYKNYSYKIFPLNYNGCVVAFGHSTEIINSIKTCTSVTGEKFTYSSENDFRIKTDIESMLRPSLELYRFDNKKYPDSLEQLVPNYLVKMPLNPNNDQPYFYQVGQDKLEYTISSTLEDRSLYKVNSPK